MIGLLKKLFGTKSQRDIKLMKPLVARINELEAEYQRLTDEQFKGQTEAFRRRLAQGEALDDLLCEAFATVKNACRRMVGLETDVCGQKRVWDMVPFDVQLMGGIALHKGKIAEMATGEGKTLVATLPLYLNALTGKPVHLVTVNDYLARRDSEWMGHVFAYLGLTCGCIQNWMSPAERRAEYAKDITYGTNSEFGFDYLRDNGMAFRPEDQVQRGHFFAIVDEVDSILIDEARTPLIISGPSPESTHQFEKLKPRVERLVRQQSELCSKYMQEVREMLPLVAPDAAEAEGVKAKAKSELTLDEAKSEVRHRLYQVYHGMPKHKQLLHLMEIPAVRTLHEQVENMMLTDMNKDTARALTEELFFATDERGHEASLTEKGCQELNPADPDAYVLPDIVAAMSDIDGDAKMEPPARTEAKQKVQQLFAERSERIQNVDQLIRAYCLYERDVHYVVMNNQVLIVDEFTGRILPGRRWSDGLHQAVEAKEGVKIEQETQTLATITIQNYFRMYEKLAGMTGTAETEADEFLQIYKLDVMVVPTNRPVRRVDNDDRVYKTKREKFKAIIDEIVDCHKRGQPVLVGTISVETSELLARMLRGAGVLNVNVLNAKYHEKEAQIVADAGQKNAITIATNMAGRGTDIKLGEGVVPFDRSIILSPMSLSDKLPEGKTLRQFLFDHPGGLHVIGTERHESRRIDRQLRGRCARQGDPGSSRFYTSLEDDLMRLFCPDRVARLLTRWGLEEGQELESSILTGSIQNAQRRVEQHNFSIRKRTLEYDDVMNKQRTIVYKLRGDIVRSAEVTDILLGMIEDHLLARAEELLLDGNEETAKSFLEWFQMTFPVPVPREPLVTGKDQVESLCASMMDRIREAYKIKSDAGDPRTTILFERFVMLRAIDMNWQDYLRSMDQLREGIRLRAYGQRDPLIEYKKEAFEMFGTLMTNIRQEVAANLFRLAPVPAPQAPRAMRVVHESVQTLGTSSSAEPAPAERRRPAPVAAPVKPRDAVDRALENAATVQRAGPKVGRNDACPCGSGKKYKKCCGAGL
ncbi:MAG: preprotein translocase subunit SecA [Kiritimatiellia bacterium]